MRCNLMLVAPHSAVPDQPAAGQTNSSSCSRPSVEGVADEAQPQEDPGDLAPGDADPLIETSLIAVVRRKT